MATVSDNDPNAAAAGVSKSSASDRRPAHTEPTADAIAAEAAAIYPDTFDTAPTPEEIAAEAYAIYQARGGDHGRDQDDWLEAERRVLDRRQTPR
jgi:hypothetical protein